MMRWRTRLFVQVLLVLAMGVAVCTATVSKSPDQNLSAHEFKTLLERHQGDPDVVLLDIRTPAEFRNGHIQGARLVDFYSRDYVDRLKSLDRQKTYLIYCRSGNRSGRSLQLFHRLGFRRVYHLQPGLVGWARERYPLDG